ncbi:MAG: BatD family protein [Bacteroidia bacterium]
MKRLISLLLTSTIYAVAVAQSFTAAVTKNTVVVGEQFQVTFTIEGNAKNFGPPAWGDFSVLGGPYQSNQTQWTNGVVSQTTGLTYLVSAKKEGKLTIGSATVESNGKKLSTNPITITVVKNTSQAQGNQQGNQQGSDASGLSSKNVFLKAFIDKTNVYRGEGITVTYKLYFNVNVYNYALEKAPSFTGFFNQDIKMPDQPVVYNENVNGVQYKVAALKKVILFPQQSGTLSIDEMKGECVARVQVKRNRNPNDPFDVFNDPFFGNSMQDVKVNIKTDPIKITVKDFPANAPESFKGAVGHYAFDAHLDKNEIKANDAVNLKVKISGKGNLKLLENPTVNFPPQIESYDPKVNENIAVNEGGTSGSKTFEYLMIPRTEGNYQIPAIDFTYFDLDKKSYVTLSSGQLNLKVGKGEGNAATLVEANSISKADVAVLGKDIRYIKTNSIVFSNSGEGFYGSPLFYALLLSPFLLVGAAFVYAQKLNALNSNAMLVKSRGATKLANKRLAFAKKFMNENKSNEFYEETYKALNGYLSDKLAIPVADLTKETASAKLFTRKVSNETVNKLITTLDMCEFARFAPSAASTPQTIYNDAVNIITKIESEIV